MPGHDTFGFNHDPNDENTAWSLGTEHAFFFTFLFSHGTAFILGVSRRNKGSRGPSNILVLVDV